MRLMVVSLCFILFILTQGTDAFGWLETDIKATDTIGESYAQQDLSIIHLDDQKILIGFNDERLIDMHAFFTTSTDGGGTWGYPVEVDDSCTTGCQSKQASLAFDPGSDLLVVVYVKLPDGQYYPDIFCRFSTSHGANWSSPVQVNDDTADLYEHSNPVVAIDPVSHYVHVAWQDMRNGQPDIYYANSINLGASFSANLKVNPWNDVNLSDMVPSIDAAFGGKVAIAFETRDQYDQAYAYVAASDDGGVSFPYVDQPCVSAYDQYKPVVCFDPGNNLLFAAWSDQFSADRIIFVANSVDFGQTFNPPAVVSGNATDALNPRLFCMADGDLHLVWDDSHLGSSSIYHAISFDHGESFQGSTHVSHDSSEMEQLLPVISGWSPARLLNVAWIDYRDSVIDHNIYTNFYRPTFYDGFADGDFSNWTTADNVFSSNERAVDGDGYSARFGGSNRAPGDLVQVLPELQQGTVDFWFWDGYGSNPLYESVDFQINLSYDDGTKAGVVRALGVVNANSNTRYQSYNGNTWTVIEAIPRSEGWHRVTFDVSATGLTIQLDAADYPALQPVYSDALFRSFDQVEFTGGSDSAPYFLDAVSIETYEPLQPAVPALSGAGLLLLLIGLALLLKRVRR
ncbi:exo-alpha-sialidase [bacterium]|nr:exo-alpha-sialidase [candidate division CSSED10-310 bacterium]